MKISQNFEAFSEYMNFNSHVHVLLYDVKFNGEIYLYIYNSFLLVEYSFFESKCSQIDFFHLFFNFLCKNIFF